MKYMNVIFLLFVSNLIVAMEVEPKNVTWRVDKEIQFTGEEKIDSAYFNRKGTKINAWADEYIHRWNRADGEYLGGIYDEDFCLTKPSDESSSEDSFEPGFTHGQDGQIFHSTSDDKELLWLNELAQKNSGRPEMHESKKIMIINFRNQPTVYVWDREAKKELSQLVHQSKINSLSFYKSEKVITTSDDGVVRAWNGSTGEELFKITSDKPVNLLKFCESEKIITTADDCAVRVWNGRTGEELSAIMFDKPVISADFNKLETEMVVATEDGKIHILVKEEALK